MLDWWLIFFFLGSPSSSQLIYPHIYSKHCAFPKRNPSVASPCSQKRWFLSECADCSYSLGFIQSVPPIFTEMHWACCQAKFCLQLWLQKYSARPVGNWNCCICKTKLYLCFEVLIIDGRRVAWVKDASNRSCPFCNVLKALTALT
jgi:hypothetical protein